jgi:hypothetical protein
MCGFDGTLGHPVAIEATHVRWHSQQGPDEMANALALSALHHALVDLGITEGRRIRVSSLYVVGNEAGQAVDALAGKPLLIRAHASRQSTSFASPGTTDRSSRRTYSEVLWKGTRWSPCRFFAVTSVLWLSPSWAGLVRQSAGAGGGVPDMVAGQGDDGRGRRARLTG